MVGGIMRTCGAFFIRRAVKGCHDATLYKALLDTYMHTLIFHGISTEFFIEGGRSRDGRIAVPKLGLLAACVDASLSKRCTKTLHIVPVTITYDVPLEEAGLLLELMGQKKKKETVRQFVSAFGSLLIGLVWRALVPSKTRPLGMGGRNGRVAVGFGEPVPVVRFLKEREKRKRKRGGKKGSMSQLSSSAGAPSIVPVLVASAAMRCNVCCALTCCVW
jgi:glycerol-3-phosphate O-acyltransferase